ncbi:folate family ECF transporter S component [Oscillospiraceae bacterium HV4-5-C5C]|nr:folate family ECF transporter S component [Oscillospiraceae bacterium HV4-5-C5C]
MMKPGISGSVARPWLSLRKLAVLALFTALSVLFTRIFSFTLGSGSLRIGLGPLPVMLAGILLGPWSGLTCGLVADVLGFMLFPSGTFHPGFTLAAGLEGCLPGLIAWAANRLTVWRERLAAAPAGLPANQPSGLQERPRMSAAQTWERLPAKAVGGVVADTLICSVWLRTFWLTQLLGVAFIPLLISRLPGVIIQAVVYAGCLLILLPALKKAWGGRPLY